MCRLFGFSSPINEEACAARFVRAESSVPLLYVNTYSLRLTGKRSDRTFLCRSRDDQPEKAPRAQPVFRTRRQQIGSLGSVTRSVFRHHPVIESGT